MQYAPGFGLPLPTSDAVEADGPSPAAAGAGMAAFAHGMDQAAAAFGSVHNLLQAHQDVVSQNQLAQTKSAIDTEHSQMASEYQYDADGFAQNSADAKSNFLKSVPGPLAVEASNYWDLSAASTQRQIAGQGIMRDHVLAIQGLNDRNKALESTMSSEYASGAPLATAEQSPGVLSSMQEWNQNLDNLVAAKGISQEDADLQRAQLGTTLKAAAFTGHVLQIKSSQGTAAAAAEIERLQGSLTPGAEHTGDDFEAGVLLGAKDVHMMVAQAKTQLATSIRLDNDQRIATNQENAAQQTQAQSSIDNYAAAVELKGLQGAGPAPDQAKIQAALGDKGVLDLANKTATAIEANTRHGSIGTMTPDQFAAHMADMSQFKQLPEDIKTPEDFDTLFHGVLLAEHGVDANGNPLVSPKGALGASQLTLSAARQAAKELGLNIANAPDSQLQAALMDRDQTLNMQLGRQYLRDQMQAYGGDPFLATNAYHAGQGNVNKWITQYGDPRTGQVSRADWASQVRAAGNPESAAYAFKVGDAAQGGKSYAAYDKLSDEYNTLRPGFVADPLGQGQSKGLVQPVPLNPVGFAGSQADQQAFAASLAKRQAQGQAFAASHPGLPARMLTEGEAKAVAASVGSDPAKGIALAQAATTAVGADGAMALFREIGQREPQANIGIQTGALAAAGATRVVSAVQQGLRAKQAGAQEPPLPKVAGRPDSWEGETQAIAPAFRYVPGALQGVVGTARMARLGDAQGGTPDVPRAYITAAMGGTHTPNGEVFGGVAPVNGLPTIHPSWMKQGAMPAALKAVGDIAATSGSPPVFANGQPMTGRDLANMQVYAWPDGTYRLANPKTNGGAVLQRGGQPFSVNFEAMKGMLANRGGIVMR